MKRQKPTASQREYADLTAWALKEWAAGTPVAEIAAWLQCKPASVRKLAWRYQVKRPAGYIGTSTQPKKA